jgi:hypothetical protein
MTVGQAQASNLGVEYLAGTSDNLLVAKIGKRHHLRMAVGALCNEGGLGQLFGGAHHQDKAGSNREVELVF